MIEDLGPRFIEDRQTTLTGFEFTNNAGKSSNSYNCVVYKHGGPLRMLTGACGILGWVLDISRTGPRSCEEV